MAVISRNIPDSRVIALATQTLDAARNMAEKGLKAAENNDLNAPRFFDTAQEVMKLGSFIGAKRMRYAANHYARLDDKIRDAIPKRVQNALTEILDREGQSVQVKKEQTN